VIVLTSPVVGDRPDLDDNRIQAEEIAACLAGLGHMAVVAPFDPHGPLPGNRDEPIFNLVEDMPGGQQHIHEASARFDAEGRSYTGCRTWALEVLGDKRPMKRMLAAAGLPVAKDLPDGDGGGIWIVKSATEHASLGLTAANVIAGAAVARALIDERRAAFGGEWFAEAYVEGREFNVGVLEVNGAPLCLPIAEIRFTGDAGGPQVVGYDAKWLEDSAAYSTTPRVFPEDEPGLLDELRRLSLACWELFRLDGCARVDFRVDRDGRPVILEVNANPCLARDAGLCVAAERAGLSQTDVVSALLDAAR
jgi:D-alanine-D-alanine ligase